MKLVAYSDLHAHPFKNGTLTEHGRNSRVDDAVSVINQAYDHAEKIGAEYVVFGGDLFDRRKSIDVDTFNRVHSVVSNRSKAVKTLMIPGNHDQANKSGTIHALQRFGSGDQCIVFSEPVWVELGDGVGLFGIPYYDDGQTISEYARAGVDCRPEHIEKAILLMHYGVYGAKVGPSDYVLPCELNLSMLDPDHWDIILSGHYHIGQQIGDNFHYIGSAMQHRWDDAGFNKSFLVIDTDDFSLSRTPTVAPRFVVFKGQVEGDVDNCFVRLVTDYEIEFQEKEKIISTLTEAGAISVEFRYEPKQEIVHEERISFSEEKGLYGVVEEYVGSGIVDTDGLDEERLVSVGKNILSQCAINA